jgi:predicted cupin superfamily sugar epimerase
MPLSAEEIIELLGLEPHPLEGGFFRETYRTTARLPDQERALGTAIFYLLTAINCSYLHKLPTDELYHFYLGDPVEQLHLFPDSTGRIVTLGDDLAAGQRPQMIVPSGVWQGASLVPGGQLALLGTTMSPGFAYQDYEAGVRAELVLKYPEFSERISRLTRER